MDMNQPVRPYANKGNLREGSITKHLIRLTLPMTWGIFAIISFQVVDTYYVSLLGTEQLAALSLTFPVTMAVFSLFIGFQIAMSSVGSRLIGSGEMDVMRRVTTHSVMLVFILGIIIALAGIALHDPIFGALGATDTLMPMIHDYMFIWFAGAMFVTIPMVGNAAMRASGDAMTPAIIMTLVAVINLILDPILIFGLFGFPRMEIQGAAIATIFANAIAMMIGLYVNYFRKNLLCRLSAIEFKTFGDSAKRLLVIALPAGLTSTIQPLINAFIMSLLAGYGIHAVAAFGVVTRIEAFCFIILMALSTGMAPIIGQNWGAGAFDRVNETLKKAIGFNVIWSVLIAILLGLFARPIAGLFSDDAELIDYAVLFFWIVPFSYAFGNLIMGWSSAFNAMGMPKNSVLMIAVKMIVMLLPALYIGEKLYGVTGLFAAIAIVNVLAGSIFHYLNWRKCRKMEIERTTKISDITA